MKIINIIKVDEIEMNILGLDDFCNVKLPLGAARDPTFLRRIGLNFTSIRSKLGRLKQLYLMRGVKLSVINAFCNPIE